MALMVHTAICTRTWTAAQRSCQKWASALSSRSTLSQVDISVVARDWAAADVLAGGKLSNLLFMSEHLKKQNLDSFNGPPDAFVGRIWASCRFSIAKTVQWLILGRRSQVPPLDEVMFFLECSSGGKLRYHSSRPHLSVPCR